MFTVRNCKIAATASNQRAWGQSVTGKDKRAHEFEGVMDDNDRSVWALLTGTWQKSSAAGKWVSKRAGEELGKSKMKDNCNYMIVNKTE